jgi:geranylgeranyl diphosphate synthase type I
VTDSEFGVTVDFFGELRRREQWVAHCLSDPRFRAWFRPEHLERAVYLYVDRPGKRLRPAVLLFACGAVGGDEQAAIPAAAGIELFHTWTLVHDDVIDRDAKRRGGPTVHEHGRQVAVDELGLDPHQAIEYGNDLAILAGDVQQGWSVCLFSELAARGVSADVVLSLITRLESYVVNELIRGELLDVQFASMAIDQVNRDAILEMLRLKTGVLYEFAAMAGAMIGLGTPDVEHPIVRSIGRFASHCGTAFQLQDDILGLIGDERSLGKRVGSDIREGKATLIACHAFDQANDTQRDLLTRVLGDRDASEHDVAQATRLLQDLGGVEYAVALAKEHVAQAIPCLDDMEPSAGKDLLLAWADYMVERTF